MEEVGIRSEGVPGAGSSPSGSSHISPSCWVSGLRDARAWVGCMGQGGKSLATRQQQREPRDPVTTGQGRRQIGWLGGVSRSIGHSTSGGLAAMHGSGPW